MPRVVPSQVVELIDRLFPWAATQKVGKEHPLQPSQTAQMTAVAGLVEQIPGELITVGWADYSALVVSVAAMRDAVTRWNTLGGGTGNLVQVTGLDPLSPVTLIRHTLVQCKDDVPSPATAGLSFIQDLDLRETLRRDMSAANTALSSGEWKAATVLAGSVIEALLLWALDQQTQKSKAATTLQALVQAGKLRQPRGNSFDEWDLHHFIEVTAALG